MLELLLVIIGSLLTLPAPDPSSARLQHCAHYVFFDLRGMIDFMDYSKNIRCMKIHQRITNFT